MLGRVGSSGGGFKYQGVVEKFSTNGVVSRAYFTPRSESHYERVQS